MTEQIEVLCSLNKTLTIEDMFVVKTHLGHGWKEVFRYLGYSIGQIEQFEEKYLSSGMDEVIVTFILLYDFV